MKSLLKFTVILALTVINGACKTSSGSTTKVDTASGSTVKAETAANGSEGITEKYWKLVEINGKQVVYDETTGEREAFIILKNGNSRVTGNGGCNTLNGTYEIDTERYRIKFSQMITTQMACLNMEVENQLKTVFEMTDNYSLSADGKYLSLNRARMAPLARFEVVYLK